MPAQPSPAQSAASRRNGASSHGPVTDEGKARSARNGIRHGLFAAEPAPRDDTDRAALAALRRAYEHRFQPADATERHWCEELVRAAWRQKLLFRVELAFFARMDAAARGEDVSGLPPLPSLDTIVRYRARLDRDYRTALDELETLQSLRPGEADEDAPPEAGLFCKVEPEPGTPRGPVLVASRPEPAVPAAFADLPAAATSMPPLNRHQRRALKAMERRKQGQHGLQA